MGTNGKIVLKIPNFNVSMVQVIILFFISWLLFAFNTKTIDLENYKIFYTYANSGIRFPGIEIGYYYFIRICSILGLNFQQYMMVYSLVGLIIIFTSVKKYSDRSGFFSLLFFFFFPYFYFINVQRYFMATAIIIWAIRFLFYEYKWANLKFVVTILIASTFHIYSLIALIYLLTKISNKKINIIVFSIS
ncbi:EpsG family protein, partial [Streptococcus uberis]